MKYILRMNFPLPSNNKVEYEALIHGMHVEKACGDTRLDILGDSNLVVQQTMNQCDTLSDNMAAYHELYNILEASFVADALANIGSMCSPIPEGAFYEVINKHSIKYKA